MKTYIERKLEQIKKISDEKDLYLSCDIYYDDLAVDRGKQFVVKATFGLTKIIWHFRSNHIRKSLKMAVRAIKEL